MRQDVQKVRIRTSNKLFAATVGDDQTAEAEDVIGKIDEGHFLFEHFKEMKALEGRLDRHIEKMTRQMPIVQEMIKIRGIGPILAAKCALMIDITKCPTVSSLWKFAGLSVVDGKADRPRKGEKLTYNANLKIVAFQIGDCMIKTNSPYRAIYDKEKARILAAKPDIKPIHAHRMASRKMVKLFLSHLWEVWRELEGMPTRVPYAMEYLGHTTYIEPSEYGWEVK